MNSHKIILASSSLRRIEILRKNNIEPIIMPPDVNEDLPFEVTMEQAVMFLALKKALSVEKEWLRTQPEGLPAIIAADTIVYKNGIIGKPVDFDDALQILKLLRNTSHIVSTGAAIVYPGTDRRRVFFENTEVFFKDYSEADIIQYINSGEPWDKAGGYAIQGAWGKYISHIVGDYDNVVGFPWKRISHELELI